MSPATCALQYYLMSRLGGLSHCLVSQLRNPSRERYTLGMLPMKVRTTENPSKQMLRHLLLAFSRCLLVYTMLRDFYCAVKPKYSTEHARPQACQLHAETKCQ